MTGFGDLNHKFPLSLANFFSYEACIATRLCILDMEN